MKRPKLDDYLRANAHHMTANELAVAAHISAHHIRKICREIGVRWLDTPQNPPLKAASPGFVPRPQRPRQAATRRPRREDRRTGDASSEGRRTVQRSRQAEATAMGRLGMKDDSRGLPQCVAKIETLKMEAVS
jgi:hypothetical protein